MQRSQLHPLWINTRAARLAKAQFAAELGKREPALPVPRDRMKCARCARPFDLHIASIDAKLHAIVRDQRVRSAPRELLEHLDQLRLARRAQPLATDR